MSVAGSRLAYATKTVDDLCALVVDCPHSTPEWTETGVVVLRSRNIRNGRLDLAAQPSFTTERDYAKRIQRATPQGGDLVITREAPMGEVGMLPPGLRCCLGQRMVLLRPDPDRADGRYLLFALQSAPVQHQIGMHEGTGSTVSNLRIPALKTLDIPCPTLDEQRRIAAVLGALDDKIELNRKMNRTLEAMAEAIFKSWFIDFDGVPASDMVESELGPIPKGWEGQPLRETIELAYGKALPKKQRVPGRVPVYGSGGIGGHHAEALVEGPGIIVGRKGSVGTVYWEEQDFFPIDTTFYVRSLRGQDWLPWVFFHLRGMDIQRLGADSAVPGVNRNALLAQVWVVPPDAKIAAFERTRTPLLRRLTANSEQSRTLAELRDVLLPKLISGELRVPEAERAVEAAV